MKLTIQLDPIKQINGYFLYNSVRGEVRWPSGRALGLRSERSGVRSSLRTSCCILEQDTFTAQNVLVMPMKRWLGPDMTEKLLTGTKNLNPAKQTKNSVRTEFFF